MLSDRIRLGINTSKPGIFYDAGYENLLKTGGWVATDLEFNPQGSQSKESEYLYLDVRNGTYYENNSRGYTTNIKVNLANIATLYIDWENLGTNQANMSTLEVASVKNPRDTYNRWVYEYYNFARKTSSLDVSALNGLYYIRIHALAYGGGTWSSKLKVYKIWGE